MTSPEEASKGNTADGASGGQPWFVGRQEPVLFYQVNRRMRDAPTLGSQQPEDILDHITEVLLFGEPITTGRKNQRAWRLGNRTIDTGSSLLTGQVGWQATTPTAAASGRYDEDNSEWVDELDEQLRAARAPFVFDAETRILGVLRHPSFNESTLAYVFTELLNRGENARAAPYTEWAVEPQLDEQTFRDWLRRTDVVSRVTFTARAPNPEGLEEFGQVWERMQARRAKLIREKMEADDNETGLQGIEEDEVFQGYLAMSQRGYAHVTAAGSSGGRKVVFDQRQTVAREQTEELPATWKDVFSVVRSVVTSRRGARRDPGSE